MAQQYIIIKTALGNGSDLKRCLCELPVGERIGYLDTSINSAHRQMESYNKYRICGCKCEVQEYKE